MPKDAALPGIDAQDVKGIQDQAREGISPPTSTLPEPVVFKDGQFQVQEDPQQQALHDVLKSPCPCVTCAGARSAMLLRHNTVLVRVTEVLEFGTDDEKSSLLQLLQLP